MSYRSPRMRARCAHAIIVGTRCASRLPRDGLCATLTIVCSSFAYLARHSALARPRVRRIRSDEPLARYAGAARAEVVLPPSPLVTVTSLVLHRVKLLVAIR